ncbi:MAG: hypothetical protein KJ904_05160 [Alphaproteobacteria bacterium]|nr:hypothetical protein [Alphaproteobacteria bacterium]MBU0796647.1 hypothetical protein [Alphaproteobacteria bacterium]MBU0886534.1 hypothetical protein [Alphaproteobacteria bacterium]MBU1814122.1 hypothetical protein [Alphaproteobacteria bacterium]
MQFGRLTKSAKIWKMLRVSFRSVPRRFKKNARRASVRLARLRAVLWQKLYIARSRLLVWRLRHGPVAAAILLLVLTGISAYWIPALQGILEPSFATEARLALLRSLFLTLGGALIGAAAIVSSLVLFAMQVNIERMPHGLFRRLSADLRLLSAFAATFLLAVAITGLSLVQEPKHVGVVVFAAFWGTAIVLGLFLYGYRRALILVNPARQLGMVVRRTQRELRAWASRAKRAAPLLSDSRQALQTDPQVSQHDLTRTAYFQVNRGWTDGAEQSVRYAVSFARRYAEQGDHEVSALAMSAIIGINRAYLETKGRTFFGYQLMFDNPLTSDGFINNTLEHLRQTARIGVARGDEQQIEQTLQAMAELVWVYLAIDYASPHASKTHAHLAAGYLTGEVERILPHNMPDVLMEGVRMMGRCADMLLAAEGPQGITTLVQKIGIISCAGVAREDYWPVTSTGVEQLARLSFDLLRTKSREINFVAREIRSSMALIAKLFMALPNAPLMGVHSTYLAPYYSATSAQGLTMRFSQLVNAVADAPADDVNARQVIDNFVEWAEGMYQTEKDLLLHAIEKRSQFTFDIIHWITAVTSMLIVLSNAAACDAHRQQELRKHAAWLIAVLSWVPDDEEAVKFVEHFQMTETLFEAAVDAHRRDCPELADDIGTMLLSWTFKAGRYQTGWAILQRSVYGLATLALLADDAAAVTRLKADIIARVAAGNLPDKKVRDLAALEIRGRATSLYHKGHWSSEIERGMARSDHGKMRPLLEEIADLISPETKGQAARHGFL